MTLTAERAGAAPDLTDTPERGSALPGPRRRRTAPEKIAALVTLVALAGASVVSVVSIDISIPQMLESWSNAQRFFDRVGGISFPAPGDLLYLTGLTLGLVLCGTLFAAAR